MDKVLVRQRIEKDIWRHLNEFFLVETPRRQVTDKLIRSPELISLFRGEAPIVTEISGEYRQLLTHQEIHGRFIRVKATGKMAVPEGFQWISKEDLKKIPFPKYILSYLTENG